MATEKLFSVLVLGGALLTTSPSFANSGRPMTPADNDASEQSRPQPLFCDKGNPDKCVPDGSGGKRPKDGFFCCWNTTCG